MIALPQVFEKNGWKADFEHDGTDWIVKKWVSPEQDQATIAAAVAAYGKTQTARAHRQLRKAAYVREMGEIQGQTDPIDAIGDVLDEILGWAEERRVAGDPLPAGLVRLLDKRLEIKARHPRPSPAP